jgi:hypothetical protein
MDDLSVAAALPRPAERGEGRGEGPFHLLFPLRPGIDSDTDPDPDTDPRRIISMEWISHAAKAV